MGLFKLTGTPTFGLKDCKIATWNGDGSYGTSVDVASIQLLDISTQTQTAQLEGDDGITDVAAKSISAQVQFRFGGVQLDILEIFTGKTLQSSGTSTYWIHMSEINFPYFGLCGRADGTQGGDNHIWVPKMKITDGFQIRFEYSNYAIPELTCFAVYDDQYTDDSSNPVLFTEILHSTLTEVAIPPVGLSS